MTNTASTSPRRAVPLRGLALALFAGLAAAGSAGPGATAAPSAAEIGGLWYDDTGKGAVEIKPCGAKVCGFIVWLKEPMSERTGKPKADLYNPDAGKRARPICGLQILGELKQQSDGSWDEGWVYDPKVGKSYDASIEANGRDRLTLTGYVGVKLLGKSFTWTRAPADLPRCQ